MHFMYLYLMQHHDPLHGKTLQVILEFLVKHYGFQKLGELIKVKCFTENPTLKSSLTFLRKTDWARKKVEELYLQTSTITNYDPK